MPVATRHRARSSYVKPTTDLPQLPIHPPFHCLCFVPPGVQRAATAARNLSDLSKLKRLQLRPHWAPARARLRNRRTRSTSRFQVPQVPRHMHGGHARECECGRPSVWARVRAACGGQRVRIECSRRSRTRWRLRGAQSDCMVPRALRHGCTYVHTAVSVQFPPSCPVK